MLKIGQIVTTSLEGIKDTSVVIDSLKHWDIQSDYYDGRETGRELINIEYALLSFGDSFQYWGFKSDSKTRKIEKVEPGYYLVKMGEKEIKVDSLEELNTICKAYDLAGLDYHILMRIR